MSAPKFDLRLDNYSCPELENLFDLSYPYSDAQIEASLSGLAGSMSGATGTEATDISRFLRAAADKLKSIKASGDCKPAHTLSQSGKDGSPFLSHSAGSNTNDQSAMITGGSIPPATRSALGRVAGEPAAPTGILNPTHTHTISKLVHIDSRFRDDYGSTSCSDFTVQLPYRLNRVTRMSLLEAQVPFTWHAISQARGNNTFRLIVAMPKHLKEDGVGYDHFYKKVPEDCEPDIVTAVIPVTIPDGNYKSDPGNDTDARRPGITPSSTLGEMPSGTGRQVRGRPSLPT
jgi:hypothetical protein